jgi:hypothetical protein
MRGLEFQKHTNAGSGSIYRNESILYKKKEVNEAYRETVT